MGSRRARMGWVLYAVAAFGGAATGAFGQQVNKPAVAAPPVEPGTVETKLEPFRQEIPSAAFAIEMVPIEGDADKKIKPFWISRTELTWEAFDVFVFKLDAPPADAGDAGHAPAADKPSEPPAPDAVTRPTKPYLPPDRGFGHEGYAAISLSHANAAEFCRWLSEKSKRKFRLATEDEWELACGRAPDDKALADSAWFAANAEDKPHPVGKKSPNARGLHDMLGNVAEWVDGRDGKPVVKGGHFRDKAEALTPKAREPNNRAWNASDPQIPKSKWWLADGPFIGFRIVCEPTEQTLDPKPGK